MSDRSVKRAGELERENIELRKALCVVRDALNPFADTTEENPWSELEDVMVPGKLCADLWEAARVLKVALPCQHEARVAKLETALAAEQGAHAETMRALARDANANMSDVPRVKSPLHAQLRAALDALCIAERDLKDSRTLHAEMRKERDELQAILDKQHSRVTAATKLWRAAHPGNDLVWPDLGRLIEWLIERGERPNP